MRKILVIVIMAALSTVLLAGCKSDNLVPYFTRWASNTDCGVAPLLVQFTARASGGNLEADPTGANSYLNISWDFRDGSTGDGSIVFHTFETPGIYDVALTVRDKDGDGETQHLLVTVRDDSLSLRALPVGNGTGPDTTVTASEVVQFGLYARTCGFDTDNGNYENRFLFRWDMGDAAHTIYTGRSPRFIYGTANAGLRHAIVTVTDDQYGVTRHDTVSVQVNVER
ncbi:MAG: PKD domain-containing protein [Candidatus Krumholzibacteriia bacterium]